MGRRASHRMFRDFLCSLVIGFLTGYITSHTVLVVLWRRQEAACRSPGGWGRPRPPPTDPKPLCDSDIPTERLVFIGVMTARRYLKTRAEAIYKTWGKHAPGRLVFFVGTGENYETSLPVIVLSDVADDEYPPQRKSFEMLRHMSSQHGHDFHWFVRLDDDVFVNTERLRTFLNSINSSQHLYMGHPGTGKADEKGNLGLHDDKPYCMGGPGVILSGPTLRQVAPHLLGCLNDTVTSHEDSELGRCVEKVTGLSCTIAREFDGMFSQNYNEKTGAWTVGLKAEKQNAISFHPIKQPMFQFSLRIMLLARTVREKMKYMDVLVKEKSFLKTSGFVSFDDPEVKNCWSSPCDVDSGEIWSCVNAYDVYSINSDDLRTSILHKGRAFGLAEARHALGQFLKRERIRKRLRLSPISYQRVSPQGGLEHVLITRIVKANYLLFRSRQKFDPIYFREIPPRKNRQA
ncbi:chondroitin sulfate synthase 1-like [Haliotis rufescens]|uniref:chondroitin sulfate synthase 1-like n=1 Tax=Haliotis rufescens TaxID=6454 RepID=UPI00201F5BB5|nr:chondroitin sulfate synthase 1-like [Haliotis rufescens]XP_048247824.1 chondroitin sulfate synthase 1-like [Haliotis rufescens]